MAKLTADDYIDLFKNNIVRLLYVDRDGKESERRVTLIESQISFLPSANPNKKKRSIPKNEKSIVVWDLDVKMWRRFYIDNIMIVRSIEAIPDEQTGQ